MRRTLGLALLSFLVAAPAALASGGPVIGLDGAGGVLATGGSTRYVTLHGSSTDTVVAQLSVPQGQVVLERGIRGYWNVPAVAYDGTGGGLSADGKRLVLIAGQFGFPVRATHLLVLGARRLRTQKKITLRGQWGYDAISPDGGRLYLIHYRHGNPQDYEVRSLDTSSGSLDPAPLVDPREPDEKMTGYPMTRVMSADGRWAYTLYDGAGSGKPFIHALDTVGRRAFCIDVDALQAYVRAGGDMSDTRLRLLDGGRRLAVVPPRSRPVAFVDTKTLAVSAPVRRARVAEQVGPRADRGGTSWLLPALIPLALALLGGGVLAIRSRRRLAGDVRAR